MIIHKKISAIRATLNSLRKTGRLGFVPTMGALHEGHLQLLRTAVKDSDFTIVSIFVNPTQFNDPADYKKYPVTLEKDIEKLLREGCDILFLPELDEMYPEGLHPAPSYDIGMLDQILEGKFRPGHFQGVCRVVDKLLDIVAPDQLYMGQKDYQQCMVIRKLLDITGRSASLNICETVREPDGLAMSSRNIRLNPEQRLKAPLINRALQYLQDHLETGSLAVLKEYAYRELSDNGFRVDYVEFANAGTLELTSWWDGREPIVALVAAFIDDVRLIDNKILAPGLTIFNPNFAGYGN
jgi:pantoate--beta-alanine ligase